MSLVPAHYNFTIYQGATFYQRVILEINGEIQDLTDSSAELLIKDEPQGKVLLALMLGSGIILGGVAGTIDLNMSATKTSELTWETGIYELTVTGSNERTDVLLRGGFKVIPF